MAGEAACSTPELINQFYSEVQKNFGEVRNFTSFLRTSCTIYLTRRNSIEEPRPAIRAAG